MNKRIIILIILVIYLFPSILYADIDTLWTNRFGASGIDLGFSVIEAENGDYIMCGALMGTGGSDLFIERTNSNGDTIWTKSYDWGGYEDGRCIIDIGENEYAICGMKGSIVHPDIIFLKINGDGDTIWTRFYDFGNTDDIAWGVHMAPDGGFVIVGFSNITGSDDMLLIKTDSLGEIEWTQTYGEDGEYDVAYDIALTDDGGYILVGGGSYASMVRLDSAGNVITKRNDGSYFYSIIKAPHNTFVVAGERLQWGNPVIYIMKTDDQLIRINYRTYSSSGWTGARSISPTTDNLGYIVGGYTDGYWFNSKIYIMRLNTIFDKIWDYSLGGDSDTEDNCFCVRQTSDGNYIACGDVEHNHLDALFMKVGLVQNAVEDDSTNIPTNYLTLTSYPNPFNATTEIKYYLPTNQNITLDIYDLLGRKVETLYDGRQPAGNHIAIWDASGFSSGIYFCRLTSGGKSKVIRMTLLK